MLLIGAGLVLLTIPSYGNQLLQKSLTLNDGSPGVTSQYKLAFTISTADIMGSIRLEFCVNNPFIGEPCTAPNGFDAQTAILTAQSGETGFSKSGLSTANELILSRVPSAAQTIPVEYAFSNVTNPASTGSYYVRLETFASDDASGSNIDQGGLAFSITNLVRINAEVPPYLTFCTGIVIDALDCSTARGNYADFGEFSPIRTSTATSQMLVATNADDGYRLSVTGNTLAAGNNIINALTNADVSRPGTAQFGLNLRANTTPASGSDIQGPGNGQVEAPYNQPDQYVFNNGNTIASATGPDDFRKYTASYLVNVPKGQAAGIYVSTLTFIATGNF